jgi:hypothetical protein
MVLRADFEIVRFYEHLGNKKEDLTESERGSTEWQGDKTTKKEFEIDGAPTEDSYIILGLYNVDSWGHKVLINGVEACSITPGPKKNWQTQMLTFKGGAKLKKGTNTIQLVRDTSTGDNFLVDRAVIHWRETEPSTGKVLGTKPIIPK